RELGKRLGDARPGLKHYPTLAKLGNRMPEPLRLVTGAAGPLLERGFEPDVLRAALPPDAVIGALASIPAPGTAYVLLHDVMGTAGGARGVWGYVEGGMGQFAQSVWNVCQQLGVELVRDCEVARIETVGGRAVAVTDSAGKTYSAKVVASSV